MSSIIPFKGGFFPFPIVSAEDLGIDPSNPPDGMITGLPLEVLTKVFWRAKSYDVTIDIGYSAPSPSPNYDEVSPYYIGTVKGTGTFQSCTFNGLDHYSSHIYRVDQELPASRAAGSFIIGGGDGSSGPSDLLPSPWPFVDSGSTRDGDSYSRNVPGFVGMPYFVWLGSNLAFVVGTYGSLHLAPTTVSPPKIGVAQLAQDLSGALWSPISLQVVGYYGVQVYAFPNLFDYQRGNYNAYKGHVNLQLIVDGITLPLLPLWSGDRIHLGPDGYVQPGSTSGLITVNFNNFWDA